VFQNRRVIENLDDLELSPVVQSASPREDIGLHVYNIIGPHTVPVDGKDFG
jgi:hypothetical protein